MVLTIAVKTLWRMPFTMRMHFGMISNMTKENFANWIPVKSYLTFCKIRKCETGSLHPKYRCWSIQTLQPFVSCQGQVHELEKWKKNSSDSLVRSWGLIYDHSLKIGLMHIGPKYRVLTFCCLPWECISVWSMIWRRRIVQTRFLWKVICRFRKM